MIQTLFFTSILVGSVQYPPKSIDLSIYTHHPITRNLKKCEICAQTFKSELSHGLQHLHNGFKLKMLISRFEKELEELKHNWDCNIRNYPNEPFEIRIENLKSLINQIENLVEDYFKSLLPKVKELKTELDKLRITLTPLTEESKPFLK